MRFSAGFLVGVAAILVVAGGVLVVGRADVPGLGLLGLAILFLITARLLPEDE